MTSIALTDSEPVLTALAGKRIPRRAWANVMELTRLLGEAGRVLETARRQAEFLRRRAYSDGRAAGVAQAQALATQYLLEAQRQAREFMDASEERIIALAVSIVARIAPGLDQAQLVAALASEALAAVNEERRLRVRVSPAAEETTRTMLEEWQRAHPEIESAQVLADPDLELFACVVESELGRIEIGLSSQLQALREALASVATESRR